MANTVEIDLPSGQWTKLASGKASGYIDNRKFPNFLVKEDSDILVSGDVIGYVVSHDAEVGVTFDIANGQAVYARPTSENSVATLTIAS
jgi:hypothetical protein